MSEVQVFMVGFGASLVWVKIMICDARGLLGHFLRVRKMAQDTESLEVTNTYSARV